MNPSDYDGLTDQEFDALMRKFKAEQRCSICGCSSQEVIAITEGPRNAPRVRHEWNTPADLLQCIYCLRRIHFDIHQGGMVRGQCPLCSKQCATPSRECAICHSKLLSGKVLTPWDARSSWSRLLRIDIFRRRHHMTMLEDLF